MPEEKFDLILPEHGVNLFTWEYHLWGFCDPRMKQMIGVSIPEAVIEIEREFGRFYASQAVMSSLATHALAAIMKRPTFLPDLARKQHLVETAIYRNANRLERLIKRDDHAGIVRCFSTLWKAALDMTMFGAITVFTDINDSLLTQTLRRIAASKGIPGEQIESIVAMLSSCLQPTMAFNEQRALDRLIQRISRGASLPTSRRVFFQNAKRSSGWARFLQSHWAKWRWVQYGYQGPAWSYDDVVRRAYGEFRDAQRFQEQSQQRRDHFRDLRARQEQLFKRWKFSQRERRPFAIAQTVMTLKATRADARNRFQYCADQLFGWMSKRSGYTLKDFRSMLVQEVIAVLNGSNHLSSAILRQRQAHVFGVCNGRSVEIASPAQEQSIRAKKMPSIPSQRKSETREIRGQSAYPGIVRGIARMISDRNDLKKIRAGDILVSIQTMPEYLSGMHRAGAFVTDIGGITSHAAIVSREMKKPCIVGTKIATQVIRDGDYIEVDANRGIVRML